MTCYRISKLNVRYGRIHAVRDFSFEIYPASAIAIVGHNGAGKTSILHALTGNLPSDAFITGTLSTPESTTTAVLSNHSRLLGRAIVPEREKVFPLMTVWENLLAASRYENQKSQIRIDDVFGFFPRLAERRATLAGNLSGGEQQMLAIGCALLGTPQVLLVDEPTLGLAVPVIEFICEKLAQLRRELGLAIICSVAETAWIGELAEKAIIIDAGEQIGAPVDTTQSGRDEVEARLAGIENLVTGNYSHA